MRKNLLAWQFEGYPRFHARRRTLLVHILTVPLFWTAWALILAGPVAGWPALATGAVLVALCVAAQGKAHALEPNPPEPFLGPLDGLSRLWVEQWVTFPRFALSGGLAAAWRQGAAQHTK